MNITEDQEIEQLTEEISKAYIDAMINGAGFLKIDNAGNIKYVDYQSVLLLGNLIYNAKKKEEER
jgi:hypothetical protein